MSKVQFNLLPDSKLNLDRAQRIRDRVVAVTTLVTIVAVGLFLVLFVTVDVLQKKQMDNAGKSLDKASADLKKVPQIGDIITVQNQLKSLATLHQNKHVTSRLFDYLPQVTPSNATISGLTLDLKQSTMTISGNADSQRTVNAFVDTLKYTKYKVNDSDQPADAFMEVRESSFSLNANDVNYSIDLKFDPKLFANNLVDSQGKAVTPKLIISNQSSPSSANTLFKSSNGGGQ